MSRDRNNDRLLLNALADDELDASTVLALELRIASEPGLAAEYEQIRATRVAMTRLKRPIVSDDFSTRIAALAAPPQSRSTKATSLRRDGRLGGDWRAMAASLVVTAGLASGLTYTMVSSGDTGSIETAVANAHRRSLLATSPIDIASSDRHTVRPWLDAKLGVSPLTPDLTSLGFLLVGGRVDVIADRPVPSLVYRHQEHLISVVAIPVTAAANQTSSPHASAAGSYNVIRWSGPGFRYWAISDLDAAELARFVDDLRAK